MTASPPKADWFTDALERCRRWDAGLNRDCEMERHSIADLPRALAVIQAADVLLEAVMGGSHLVDEDCGHERCIAIRAAKSVYLAARHGEPQEGER